MTAQRQPLAWVFDGQRVWVPAARMNMSILCTVVTAMGDTARVANEELRFDDWYDVDQLIEHVQWAPNAPQTGVEVPRW